MRPAINTLHQSLIDIFTELGGYDSVTLYCWTPRREYRIHGLVNAAALLSKEQTWKISTKQFGVVAVSPDLGMQHELQ